MGQIRYGIFGGGVGGTRNLETSMCEKSKLVELSSTDTEDIMGLTDDTRGCLMASTLQLKMLAMLLWEWAIANLYRKLESWSPTTSMEAPISCTVAAILAPSWSPSVTIISTFVCNTIVGVVVAHVLK